MPALSLNLIIRFFLFTLFYLICLQFIIAFDKRKRYNINVSAFILKVYEEER